MEPASENLYAHLSPFELKDRLVELATQCTRHHARLMLDAGRGNPDWMALEARRAFLALGQFALLEAETRMLASGIAGHPPATGIASRLLRWTGSGSAGAGFLRKAVELSGERFGFKPDALVHELVLGVLGVNYPMPVRMLEHVERIVRSYLDHVLSRDAPPAGRFELFATEGATAGICYVFQSLLDNELLHRGDRVAIGVPAFTPYLEIPRLGAYCFEEVPIVAAKSDGWQYPDSEIDKLADPSVRAFFLINPGNPTSVAIRPRTLERIAGLIRTQRPDLIVISDDVYATYAEGYRSLAAAIPANTIAVYSFSKYFGCTGWRLGVIGIHEDNILDRQLAQLPTAPPQAARYRSVSVEPERLRFIDRLAADSRAVALNHTAGLSTPQQVQMALFAMQELLDSESQYNTQARGLVMRRLGALYGALGLEAPAGPLQAGYYATIDLIELAGRLHGADFARQLQHTRHPLDFVFQLAREYATVVLPGAGFDAPDWSVRISLANLPEEAYREIGMAMRAVLDEYR
jgi:aspartate 4-decarboxylase